MDLRPLAAEALGTSLLLIVVVGSGIMGERLAGGNVAIALLANSFATGLGLFVLILVFSPISGAHLNPVVSLVAALRGEMTGPRAAAFVLAQVAGAVVGVCLAHAMFDLPLLSSGIKVRTGIGQWLAEGVATFGLVGTILGCARYGTAVVAAAVGAYIASAYWFTASTSFANPAVTIARALTDTFTGIRATDVLLFIAAQIAGATLAFAIVRADKTK